MILVRLAAFALCVALPATSWAYDLTPKAAETGFSGKLKPDILGLSTETDGARAKEIAEAHFKGRQGVKPTVAQSTFASTAITFIPAMTFEQTNETMAVGFTSPASGNRAFIIARTLAFPGDQPPKADMLKQVIDKYGSPTLIGDQHVYYFYRGGKIVTVGQKYKPDEALTALDKPLNAKAAVALNNAKGQGSCVAAIKRIGTLDKTLKAMFAESKDANCDGALSIVLASSASPDRVGKAEFMLVDFKRIVSASAIDEDAATAAKADAGKKPAASAPRL